MRFGPGWQSAATFAAVCVLASTLVSATGPARAQDGNRVWNMRVYLDDTPIGTHRFTLRANGPERELSSEAQFEFKFLGLTAYRYKHQATETWRDNCLAKFTARTNDDGKQEAVDAARDGERFIVTASGAKETLPGCVMSFAYWNPQMLRQSRLLNAQTGQYEAVNIAPAGEESITLAGRSQTAKRYRLTGPESPLELYYGAGGEWLGLDSMVKGGRRLRYRLEEGK